MDVDVYIGTRAYMKDVSGVRTFTDIAWRMIKPYTAGVYEVHVIQQFKGRVFSSKTHQSGHPKPKLHLA